MYMSVCTMVLIYEVLNVLHRPNRFCETSVATNTNELP